MASKFGMVARGRILRDYPWVKTPAGPAAIVLMTALLCPAVARAQASAPQPPDARAAELEEYTALFVSLAQQALAHPRLSSPMPCLPHWLAGNDHVVVAVSAAGGSAGLAPGDVLQRIGDAALTGLPGGVWDAAMRDLKPGASWFTVAVSRRGTEIRLVLPCASNLATQLHRAERAMWSGVTARDWSGCIAGGGDMIRAFGHEFSPPLMIMTRCASARRGETDAALTSRLGHALLAELVSHPEPSPDLREQLFLTLRDLEAIPGGAGEDYGAALRTEMIERGIPPPARTSGAAGDGRR